MKAMWACGLVVFVATLALGGLSGCGQSSKAPPPPDGGKDASVSGPKEGKELVHAIQEQLSKLGPEDGKLAAAQVFCVVMDESRLGSMGVPIKVMVEDQPVFVCCKGCVRRAQMNPKETLEKRAELLRKKI